jgi:hypothetical protein
MRWIAVSSFACDLFSNKAIVPDAPKPANGTGGYFA